jgi:hypothetical protein
VENVNEAVKLNEVALKDISMAETDLGRTKDYLQNDQIKLKQIRDVFDSNANLPYNDINRGTVLLMTNLSETELRAAERRASLAGALRTNADLFEGSIWASGPIVVSMASAAVFLAERMVDIEPIKLQLLVEELNKPTPRDRHSELSAKLTKIEAGLTKKLDGAWDTLQNDTNEDRFSQAAHSAREVISDLLDRLAPNERVMTVDWFKPERDNGNPTHFQRAKYAIIGSNRNLKDEDLKPIDDLSKNIRKFYKTLNKLAHQRDYTNELQKMTENQIDQVQIYLLNLLELRERYFTE